MKSIQVDTFTCKGVVLANGEEISADNIISAADPKHTFLTLVGAVNLPPEFVWNVQSIKMRGSVAKVHLLTDGNHGIPDGTLVVAPSIKYLEKAYDAAKYHAISENPYLEVTTSGNVVSIHFQFAPYNLKDGTWDVERETVKNLAINTLAEYFPNLQSLISNSHDHHTSRLRSPLTASPKATSTTVNSCSINSCSCVPSLAGRITKLRSIISISAEAESTAEGESAVRRGEMRCGL